MLLESDDEIESLLIAFRERTLPKTLWTHEAHLIVALCFILSEAPENVVQLVRSAIRALNESHGTPNTDERGYHETLTVFWLNVVADFVRRETSGTTRLKLANGILAASLDSKLPLRHYTRERLFSVEARRVFVAPDIEEFERIV